MRRFVLMTLALFTALPARAEHAIAMHGAPRYPADFRHFAYVDPDAPQDGTLRLGVTGAYDTINPFSLRGRAAYGVNPSSGQIYLYDSLLARSQDEPFTLYGLIAEDVSTPDDRSSVTFKLNPAARFHDGTPITSADVLFSWDSLRRHGRPNQRTYYNKVARAEAPDERTVIFHFKPAADGRPDRELPLIMGLMAVLPKHVWQDKDIGAPTLTPPVGSGPYRIAALEPGRSITWEKVPDYWAASLPSQRGLYNFGRIRVDYYRDEQVALQAFKAGQFDLRREADPARWQNGYDGSGLRDGRYRLVNLPHRRVDVLRAYAFNLRRPLFQDRVLRQAVAMAFDFDWLNRVLFHGAFRRTQSAFPNSALAARGLPAGEELALLEPWRSSLPPELFTQPFTLHEQDHAVRLRAARHLLLEHGYGLRDGRLLTPGGAPVAFTILLNEPAEEKTAAHLARSLRALGMDVRLRVLDSAQYQAQQMNFDFDMMLVRWVNSLSPGNEQAIYWGSAAADQPGSRNYPGVRSPAVDALIRAVTAARSRAALESAVHALDRVLMWGFYMVPLYYQPEDHLAVSADLRWPETIPTNGAVLESWWRQTNAATEPKQ